MFPVTTVPAATSDAAIHPLIGFAVDVDGECLASGELLNASWIGDETGQVITVRWEDGRAEAARAIVQAAVAAAERGAELHLTANTEVHYWIPERITPTGRPP